MSFSLTLSDVPTHVVFWQEKDKDSMLKTLTERIASLEATVASLMKKETPLLSGIEMRRAGVPPLNIAQETDSRGLFKQLIEKASLASVQPLPMSLEPRKPLPGNMYEMSAVMDDSEIKFVDVPVVNLNVAQLVSDDEAEAEAEGAEEDAEGAEAEAEEDAEGAEAEEQEEAEEAEEAEEEQALELTEFEYKGVTYFKDPENQVYQVDADGDLDDSPIGIWSEEKQKVLKYAKA
jgi:regulator of protease activity HflC (stomatin/prohibitin superfamily)